VPTPLTALRRPFLLHVELRFEAPDKDFFEPARGLALDLLFEVLAILRAECLRNGLELRARTIANDLNQDLLVSPNTLHGVAKMLGIFVRVDIGVIVRGRERETSR